MAFANNRAHSLTYVHVRISQKKLKDCNYMGYKCRNFHDMLIGSFNKQLHPYAVLKTYQAGIEIYEKTLPKSTHLIGNIFFPIKPRI